MSAVPAHIVVAGKVNDPEFQIAKATAEALARKYANVTFEANAMFESAWDKYARAKSVDFGVEHKLSPLVFYNGKHYIGMSEELLVWAAQVYKYRMAPNSIVYNSIAKQELRRMIAASSSRFAYFDVQIGDSTPQRLVFELFDHACPKTCSNFLRLCGACDQTSAADAAPPKYTYRGTPFHRVVPGGWVQGGDVVDGSGKWSESADGGFFGDESFAIPHDGEGLLAMANLGRPHTNGSQFFITLSSAAWLDRKRVVFGRVVMGLRTLRIIEKIPLRNERPQVACVVVECGEYHGQTRMCLARVNAGARETKESMGEPNDSQEALEEHSSESKTGGDALFEGKIADV